MQRTVYAAYRGKWTLVRTGVTRSFIPGWGGGIIGEISRGGEECISLE